MNNHFKSINKRTVSKLILLLLAALVILDRWITLQHFGFVYSDMDELVLWYGAMDYSKGIFHEPFFYGQAYNYMVESLLAVPLLWCGIPIYKALPLVSSFLAVFPFLTLAWLLIRKNKIFWTAVVLTIPIILSVEYNFLTTIPRGFLQAHLFIPLLYFSLFNPQNKQYITLLFIGSTLSFIANQSSIILVFPIVLYVWSFHVKSISFYLKSLFTFPFFALDYWAKQFYVIHPEKVQHGIIGLELDTETFFKTFQNNDLFEYLFPFTANGGIYYAISIGLLIFFAFRFKKRKEWLFLIGGIALILITFAIPKVQMPYPLENSKIYFSISRLYLFLPIFVIISVYLIFKNQPKWKWSVPILLVISVICLGIKINQTPQKAKKIVSTTTFPVETNEILRKRSRRLEKLVKKYDIDGMIVTAGGEKFWWENLHDSYVYNPLINPKKGILPSVFLDNDRRSWLYEDAKYCKRVLIFGLEISDSTLNKYNYERIDNNIIFIENTELIVDSLCQNLDLYFGLK